MKLVLSESEKLLRRIAQECSPSPLFDGVFWNNAHVIDMQDGRFKQGQYILRDAKGKAKYDSRGMLLGTSTLIWKRVAEAGARMGIQGREAGPSAAIVGAREHYHSGTDFFVPQGTKVKAPLAGKVFSKGDEGPGQYGPVVILKHKLRLQGRQVTFYTLYGHLSSRSLARLKIGQEVEKGKEFAEIGNPRENGVWQPHLHFQLHFTRKAASVSSFGHLFGGVSGESLENLGESGVHNLFPDPAHFFPHAPWHSAALGRSQWVPYVRRHYSQKRNKPSGGRHSSKRI